MAGLNPDRGKATSPDHPTVRGDPRPAPVPLRRNRDFILLWSGQVVSTIGTRITSVAYPLLVLALTDSPATAGVVAFAQSLPFLLVYLPAGALVDRWDRKRTMLVSDGGRAIALGSIAVALPLDALTIPHIVVVAFVEGTLFVFFSLAEGAALPRLVASEQIPTAVAQNEARNQGADLVGQPLGAFLFSVGRLVPFLVDALSYTISLIALLFVRPDLQGERSASRPRLRDDIAEGVRWLWHQPFLRNVVALIGGMNFVFNAMSLALIVRAQELGASAALIGWLLAFIGAGALIGSLVAPWLQRSLPTQAVILGAAWLWTAEMAALGLVGHPLALGIVAGAGATAGPAFNVVGSSYRYGLAPDRLLGRVQSAARLVAWGAIPLGSLAAGFLLESIGSAPTFGVLAAIMGVVALIATALPSIRNVPPLDSLRTGANE